MERAATASSSPDAFAPRRIDWLNTLFIGAAHLVAVFAIVYMAAIQFSWWSLGLGFLWFALCGLGITGGYHRLFSHPTYKASRFLEAFYLFFGAAAVQNSALKWSSDHRIHHSRCDSGEDPYNIQRGFWWAHIGWIFFKDNQGIREGMVKDLLKDPLIRLQHRFYVPIALTAGVLLPLGLGFLWGDPLGAVLIAGFLRLVIQWHATFAVNSVAHTIGHQPFSTKNSARDSFWTALITLGEGYHNFHHRFALDYRNGVRWYHLDPTKWFVWSMSKMRVTWDLKRTPASLIQSARNSAAAGRAASVD